ncbi:MAG: MFS transporter [Anaerolineae bacterium]
MKKLRILDYIYLSAYWFALSYLWNSMGPIILPNLISPPMVDEGIKGSALGLLSATGLVIAIIVQPIAGYISDRSTSRFGRRRPYLLVGTLFDLFFLLGIALSKQYWFLFLSYMLLQVSSNVAHGPYQGLIPDLVPEERRGTASGVKQFAEIVGIIVTSLATAALMAQGQTLLAIVVIMTVLTVTMLITIIGVREEPLRDAPNQSLRETVLDTFKVDPRRYPDYFWLLLSRLFILMGMNLVRNYVLYFVADVVIGPSVPYAERMAQANNLSGSLLAIIAVAIAFTALPTGMLSDRLGKKLLVLLSSILGAIGAFLMVFANGRTLLTLSGFPLMDILIFGSLIGLSAGIFLSANWALATDLIPKEEGGRYLGISNLATAGAGVLAGIGGPIRDLMGYTALFLSACLCYVLGTILLAKVREPRNTPNL